MNLKCGRVFRFINNLKVISGIFLNDLIETICSYFAPIAFQDGARMGRDSGNCL